MSEVLELHPLSVAALFVLSGMTPYFYRYADGRWWFVSEGVEYWLFDDEEGVRMIENPF